ncbi:MAG TPA: hypothetical protein VL832_01440 [Puia sp.]|jgi:hypothetical protein|nr:hypothetical protein [Puia sp.]
MEKYTIPQNIPALYVQASSFPNGVMAAHKTLHAKAGEGSGRRFFGISYLNEKGEIIYKAAANELHPGEAGELGLPTFTIRKGEYLSEVLKDWCNQEGKIKDIFQDLLKQAGANVAGDGYCLEEYINDTDVRLMVTLA